MLAINRDPSSRQLRQFAGGLSVFCAVVGAIFYWKMQLPLAAVATWTAGGLMGVLGLVHPPLVRPLFLGSMYLTFPVGWVLAHLLMAVIYYGVITPIGLLMRRLRPDPLARQFESERSSYWEPHRGVETKKRYFQQY